MTETPGNDHTGRRPTAAATAASMIAAVLDLAHDPAVLVNPGGEPLRANDRFRTLFGVGDPDDADPQVLRLWPAEHDRAYRERFAQLLTAAAPGVRVPPSTWVLADQHDTTWLCTCDAAGVAILGQRLIFIIWRVARTREERRLQTIETAVAELAADVHRLTRLAEGGFRSTTDGLADTHHLSRQQRAVLELFAERYPTSAIAARLHLSPHTVRGHLKAIYQRLGVRTKAELTALLDEHAAER